MKQAWNEYGELKLVGVRGAENSFRDDTRLDAEWQKLRFHQRPSLGMAIHEHQGFRAKLRSRGAELIELDDNDELTLDSIYTRDNIIVSPGGLILCNMGRASRTPEGPINAIAYVKHGFRVAGYIEAPGTLEGGDFIWLDEKSAAVALGPRTNQAGIEQFHDLLGRDVDLHVVPLPGVDQIHFVSVNSQLHFHLQLSLRINKRLLYRISQPIRFT
jgi:N-dimethylarginine dimethylaminohydrolase